MSDLLKIPPFLRRYDITGNLLDEAIAKLRLANECLVADKLQKIKTPALFSNTADTHNAVVEEAETNSHIRLTRTLKERTGQEILAAVEEGHDTFGKLTKYGFADERVLKASIRYALAHRVSGKSQLVKLSPRTYGVEK